MGISFSCESCKRKIKAPDTAGGKWGKCPHCQHKCYIPLPPSEDEPELVLAPIDENEETQYKSMMRETYNLTQNILHETQAPTDHDDEPSDVQEKDLVKYIIFYLRQMADGQLEQAEKVKMGILRFKPQAKQILQKMAKAERPEPELENIARPVLMAFMKELAAQL